jgi:hypothetical protein
MDFIHRLVSQEQKKIEKLKIIEKRLKPEQIKIHTSTNKSQTTEQPSWVHTHINT